MGSAILLCATLRNNNNGQGVASFVESRWQALRARRSAADNVPRLELAEKVMPSGTSLPYGPVISGAIPVGITISEQYDSQDVRAWSRVVTDATAVVIVSCQYNRGYPGQLKNVLDQLFNEWREKPCLIVTYGGHGGNFAAEQLTTVVRQGLRCRLVSEPVQIILPGEYIRGIARVSKQHDNEGGWQDMFLEQYMANLDAAIEALFDVIAS